MGIVHDGAVSVALLEKSLALNLPGTLRCRGCGSQWENLKAFTTEGTGFHWVTPFRQNLVKRVGPVVFSYLIGVEGDIFSGKCPVGLW